MTARPPEHERYIGVLGVRDGGGWRRQAWHVRQADVALQDTVGVAGIAHAIHDNVTQRQVGLALRRGEILVARDKAYAVAQHQQARSLELRAVTSLSRLWQSQGQTQPAYHTLIEIYDWFDEGFETLDLIDASWLRDSLAEQ